MKLMAAAVCVFLAVAPAVPRTIEFAGLTWTVKIGHMGPDYNYWSDSPSSVWVDEQGRLHLKIRKVQSTWYCAEVWAQQSFGYGDYIFQVDTNADVLDPRVVVGLFTYLDDNHEIDIEFSRWGNSASDAGQYVMQPSWHSGNIHRFPLDPVAAQTTHWFRWQPHVVCFQSYLGHAETLPGPEALLQEWTYTGADIPAAATEKLHLNLWLDNGEPPLNGQDAELIIRAVRVTPVPGDFDTDGDVDFADFAQFAGCLAGPDVALDPTCGRATLDADDDADLADFARFQRGYTP